MYKKFLDTLTGGIFNGKTPSPLTPQGIISEQKDNIPDTSIPPSETIGVSSSVKKEIESVMEGSNIQKLRYFLMELIRKNTGIAIPSVKIGSNNESVSVKIPGKYKTSNSISSILIQESINKKQVLTRDDRIKIGNYEIILDQGYGDNGGFNIITSGKFDEQNMELLRIFFEQTFLPEYVVNEHNSLRIENIRELLELSNKDFISLTDNFLEVTIPVEDEIIISKDILDAFTTNLNNYYDQYSVKHKKMYSVSENSILFGSIVIHDMKSGYETYLHGEFNGGKLILRVGGKHDKLKINKKFIESIFKRSIYLLRQSTYNQKDSIKSLRDMGVIVYEKSENEIKKTLTELYQEEGFMGYEDIKNDLAVNVIYPWEHKEKYTSIANLEFPHMKNIIPNTALFEGPPGTGKTTQAKIIGKYLGYPFIYVPVGKLMSKWYGESEGRLDTIFELAGKAAKEHGGIIIMIDEIDEIGGNREKSHEATARMTGVLLKKLDGIEKIENLLLIGSTNRKSSLDPALLSRFSRQVFFRLPDIQEIRHIMSLYIPIAANLADSYFEKLKGKSGRDIKNLAEDIARKSIQKTIVLKEETNIEKVLRGYLEGIQ